MIIEVCKNSRQADKGSEDRVLLEEAVHKEAEPGLNYEGQTGVSHSIRYYHEKSILVRRNKVQDFSMFGKLQSSQYVQDTQPGVSIGGS